MIPKLSPSPNEITKMLLHHSHLITTNVQVSCTHLHKHSHNQVCDISHRLICMQCSRHISTCMWYHLDIRDNYYRVIYPSPWFPYSWLFGYNQIYYYRFITPSSWFPSSWLQYSMNAWNSSKDSTIHNSHQSSLYNLHHYLIYLIIVILIINTSFALSSNYIHTSQIIIIIIHVLIIINIVILHVCTHHQHFYHQAIIKQVFTTKK